MRVKNSGALILRWMEEGGRRKEQEDG